MKLILLLGLVSSLAITACGGGGGGSSQLGSYCKPDHNPVSLKDKTNGVIETDNLAEGTYEFEASEIYYNNTEQQVRIHVSYKKNKKGDYVAEAVCVGGLGVTGNMEPVSFEVDLVSEILKEAAGKTLAKSKVAKIDLRQRAAGKPWLEISFEDSDTVGRSGKLSDYYKAGQKSTVNNLKQVIVRKSSSESHLRTHFETGTTNSPTAIKIQVGVQYTQK